jgi:hypothetical protein
LLVALAAAPASAQGTASDNRHRIEATIGGLWLGGAGMGSAQADLRSNNATAPAPFRLFSTESTMAGAGGFDGRVAYWITRTLAVEAGFVRVQPDLRTEISGDAETGSSFTVAERLDQYFIDANVVWLVERLRFRQRTVPFVSGGAGYLRQLHEGRTLVETGRVYEIGGGVRHELAGRLSFIRSLGLRLHGRAYFLEDGFQLEDEGRTQGAFSGAVYIVF